MSILSFRDGPVITKQILHPGTPVMVRADPISWQGYAIVMRVHEPPVMMTLENGERAEWNGPVIDAVAVVNGEVTIFEKVAELSEVERIRKERQIPQVFYDGLIAFRRVLLPEPGDARQV
jgi:hypothetical protein